MTLFYPFLPLLPVAMRGDNRPVGNSLTAGQERSVKAAGLKKEIPAMGLVK
ncbi:MAG: hypothetical protein P1U85_20555 [Verrucomicrobiales bacterium]|nr:hypothetical protein [Verrucomicrobiales bacterium]